MDARMRMQQRELVAAQRQRPAAPHRITFAADGDGQFGPEAATPPTEIHLEATDPTGELADWFDDIWWMEALRRWGDRSLSIHVLPSRDALLHPVVLHHVAMAERVARNWMLVGHGYCNENTEEAVIEALAVSAYDQICLVEGGREGGAGGRQAHQMRIEDLFARVRRLQQQRGATRPMLVRATSLPPLPSLLAANRPPKCEAGHSTQTAGGTTTVTDATS